MRLALLLSLNQEEPDPPQTEIVVNPLKEARKQADDALTVLRRAAAKKQAE